MARPRQTLSHLRTLFARHGVAPRRQFGQNFLIDLNIHDLIVSTAELGPEDLVLEVGPGAGALTGLMAESAGVVVAVEIDPAMAELAAEAVSDLPNVEVIHADALAGKNRINPVVVEQVLAALDEGQGQQRRFKLVANLPYNIATPLISNLLVHPEPLPYPERLVVTIQLELADRLRAEPGTGAYGSLSVITQALADVELVRTLSPQVFWPRPKVQSAVVDIRPDVEKRARIADLRWFHFVVRRVFLHRRKNLRRVLHAAWRPYWTKEAVDEMLNDLGLTGIVRAESLDVETWIRLADAMKARLGEIPGVESGPPDDVESAEEG